MGRDEAHPSVPLCLHHPSNIKHAALAAQLAFVLRAVEMAFRFADESFVVDLPKFVPADSNAFSCAARSGVGSLQRPMESRSVSDRFEFVECDDHVRKCCHERLRLLGNRRTSNRRWPVVNADRTVLGEERRHTLRILATPGLSVSLREFIQLTHIIEAGS